MSDDNFPFGNEQIPLMPYSPELQGVWIPYTGPRYKDVHHLLLKDGRVLPNYRPNGNSWYCDLLPDEMDSALYPRPGRIEDSEVSHIQLALDSHLSQAHHHQGKARIERHKRLFQGCIPKWVEFSYRGLRVVKSSTDDAFKVYTDRGMTTMARAGDAYHFFDDLELTDELTTINDCLNLVFKHKWPFVGPNNA
jgi:hypothetical protein